MDPAGILFACDTPYGHYSVADTFYNGRPARVLYSGNIEAAQSGIAKDDKPELLFDYNQRFFELIQGRQPKRVLILGGGAFTLPAALARAHSDMHIQVVELDGDLLALSRQFFGFELTANVKVRIGDGRRFLETADQTYDVIIVDVFSHATIPDSFQTAEFAIDLRRHLTKNGIAAMNVIAPQHGRRSVVLGRLHEIMQATFSDVQLFPASRVVSPWVSQNYILTMQERTGGIARWLRYAPVDFS